MQLDPRVPIPHEAVDGDVVDMDVVQEHYWPEGQSALRRFVEALRAVPLAPDLRELVRIRTAQLTGCTH